MERVSASVGAEDGPEPGEAPAAIALPVRGRSYDPRPERVIWFVLGVVDTLIGLRFLFRLLGASTEASFVTFLYSVTQPLVGPFWNIFRVSGASVYVLEPPSLVAMLVYAIIAWGIVALVRIMSSPRRGMA